MTKWNEEDRVPASAFKWVAMADVTHEDTKTDDGTYPVAMLARRGATIFHPYWGAVAHDMSGVQLAGERLTIDYCHDTDTTIGVLDEFSVGDSGLVTKGRLVPFTADDRASEVIHKMQRGVPYQASIDFAGECDVEVVGDGKTAQVNGYTFEGPGVIFRKWPLNAVAICPHGADGGTSTELAFTGDHSLVKVNVLRGSKMKKAQESEAPVAVVEQPQAVEVSRPSVAVEDLQKFMKLFGAQGAEWLLANRTIEDCFADQVTQLKAREAELMSQVADLQKRLEAASVVSGVAPLPVGAVPAEKEKPKSFFRNIPSPNGVASR